MIEIRPGVGVQIGLTGIDEIIQNVQLILATPRGSLPLDRAFGTSWAYIDMPLPRAMAFLRTEIVQTLGTYEPRIRIKSIRFESDGPTALSPVIEIEILSL